MNSIETISEDSETNAQNQRTPVATSLPLESILEVDGDTTIKKYLITLNLSLYFIVNFEPNLF